MTDEKLKACPFCGYKGEDFTPYYSRKDNCVICYACDAQGPFERNQSASIAAWNQRTEPTGGDEQ
jgi:Lar family restriction alleviation protein